MDVYGNLDLKQNALKNTALFEVSAFPIDPVVGEMCFKEKVVYLCTVIDMGIPTWLPLTNEICSYVHVQSENNTEWVISHNLGKEIILQVVDASGNVFIPNSIVNNSVNQVTVTFLNAQQGKAICVCAENGTGIHTITAHIHEQTSLSSEWVVTHNLGYKPLVQVVLSDNFQIIPAEIEHTSAAELAIRFSSSQIGTARLI